MIRARKSSYSRIGTHGLINSRVEELILKP